MKDWFVLQKEQEVGPHSLAEMVQMLQEKSLFRFDYAWKEGMDAWTPIADIPEFAETRLAKMIDSGELKDYTKLRRYSRLETHIELMFHNNKIYGYGTFESISEGGGLIHLENPVLLPTDKIMIHCRGKDNVVRPFNCEFQISNKSYNRYRLQHKTKMFYTGAFSKISIQALTDIRSLIENKNTNGGV